MGRPGSSNLMQLVLDSHVNLGYDAVQLPLDTTWLTCPLIKIRASFVEDARMLQGRNVFDKSLDEQKLCSHFQGPSPILQGDFHARSGQHATLCSDLKTVSSAPTGL